MTYEQAKSIITANCDDAEIILSTFESRAVVELAEEIEATWANSDQAEHAADMAYCADDPL